MKKYLFAIIFLLIPCSVFAVVPKVHDLYPTNKVFDAVNKIWTVPAKVVARSSTSIAYDSVALGLTKSIAGGIATSLAIAGAGYIGNMYIDWLMDQTPPMYYSGDVLTHDIPQIGYPPAKHSEMSAKAMQLCEASTGAGHCVVDIACYNRNNDCSAIPPQYGGSTWISYSLVVDSFTYLASVYGWTDGSPPNHMRHMGIVYTCDQTNTQFVPTPVTWPELFALVGADIDDATDDNAPIVDIVNKAIDKAADITKDGAGITADEGTVEKDVEDKLNLGIPADESTKLDEKLNNPDAVDEAIDKDVADADTQKSITDGVSDAMKSFFGDDVAAPSDVTLGLPSKLSLTSIMQSFMNSINNMPIITTLRGITVNASGSSVLCVDLPANYGGSKCYDASSAQSTFNMIGTILLSMTTIFCFIQLFRG